MPRSAGARACLALLVVAWLAADAPRNARAQQPDRLGADRQPYALTISGGVSLGAYEAGLNWVLLKALRVEQEAGRVPIPELVGITGASAGSINALLSALAWCEEGDGIGAVDANRFREVWIPIGFADLLPASGRGYGRDDGWLTRRAFDRTIAEIEASMTHGRFRTGCSVLLGLTVTRPDPAPLLLHGLPVTQQRVVIPLELSIEAGRPAFRPAIVEHKQELLGNTLYLAPTNPQGSLDYRAVLDAVLASSAFPLAFGRKTLVECVPVAPGQRDQDACPSGRPSRRGTCEYVAQRLGQTMTACEDDFIDGGVFDNIPLGVAVAQIESSPRLRGSARPVTYLYLEPDNRRLAAGMRRARAPQPLATMDANLTFVGGAIKTARNYELHNVLRYNPWNQHTDVLAREAARLLWSLASEPAPRGEPDALRAALDALRTFVLARRSVGEQLAACIADGGPLTGGFSWSSGTAVGDAGIVMRALPCATAIMDARPNEAELRRSYALVASRSLAAIGERFRRARVRASRGEIDNTLRFAAYRHFLLEEMARFDEFAAELALSAHEVDPLLDRIRAAVAPMQGHGPLDAYVHEAAQVLAGLQVLLRREQLEDAAPDALPAWAEKSAWALPAGALAPGTAERLEAAAAELAARHRCAAMLVASTRELAALAVHAHDQDARATLERLERIHAAATSAADAADCLDQSSGLLPAAPEAQPGSPPGAAVSQALAAAAAIADRSRALVAPHRAALRELSAIETLAEELGLLDRAQGLAEQARRKQLDVHEDRVLMLSTRFAPLASSYFNAFSGFLDEPLRRHDYLVGVYDGLYGIAEQVCRGRGVPEPSPADSAATDEWTKCLRWQLGELSLSLGVQKTVVDALARLELAPEQARGDPVAGRDNVEIVLNALVDPRRCGRRAGGERCLVDRSFGAFVAGLRRRGYTTADPYMQRALDNPGAWWVTPAMHALRRMGVIEASAGSSWEGASALAQRVLMPLEDRMGRRWSVPSVLPPRFGWGLPWLRLSLAADWIVAGRELDDGRYRLRPLGLATWGGRLALYAGVGLRVGEERTGTREKIVPEAGLALAWRNTGANYWLLSGAELAGHAALTGALRPRVDASALLLTHLRLGAGFDFESTSAYGFIGIDDPVGLAYSVGSIWF